MTQSEGDAEKLISIKDFQDLIRKMYYEKDAARGADLYCCPFACEGSYAPLRTPFPRSSQMTAPASRGCSLFALS